MDVCHHSAGGRQTFPILYVAVNLPSTDQRWWATLVEEDDFLVATGSKRAFEGGGETPGVSMWVLDFSAEPKSLPAFVLQQAIPLSAPARLEQPLIPFEI